MTRVFYIIPQVNLDYLWSGTFFQTVSADCRAELLVSVLGDRGEVVAGPGRRYVCVRQERFDTTIYQWRARKPLIAPAANTAPARVIEDQPHRG
jgi:hypothetical protein